MTAGGGAGTGLGWGLGWAFSMRANLRTARHHLNLIGVNYRISRVKVTSCRITRIFVAGANSPRTSDAGRAFLVRKLRMVLVSATKGAVMRTVATWILVLCGLVAVPVVTGGCDRELSH